VGEVMIEINKIYNEDCLVGMKRLPSKSIDLTVTSPPYYNARDYSQWNTFDNYMEDMKNVFSELYRVMKNHRYVVINVGDIAGQIGKAKWSTKKIPLGAYFTVMMEQIGYQYVDNYIWDKGEPQSKRHLGNPPYPFYQYPINCYEHILIFVKHELDEEKVPCPICNELKVVSNSQTSIGVQSWECKNQQCSQRSKSDRGKRFSKRSVMMEDYKKQENYIDSDFVKKWRRDIVKINPVIKINSKGENIVGHSAPFPKEIPEMAIRYFSGVGDIVLDPFMGSGTTAISAIDMNRSFLGFEISKEYCDVINKRIEEVRKQNG
jgi:DNA modification methylase